MADIFRYATITLAAHYGSGAESGLHNSRSESAVRYVPEPKFKIRRSNGQEALLLSSDSGGWKIRDPIFNGSLATRGWCYQENVVSPRVLHFTKSQLFWDCIHTSQTEDGMERTKHNFDDFKHYLWTLREGQRGAMQDSWYNDAIGKQVSRRSFTRPTDKLIAIAGIAKVVQSAYPMRYYAGLWEDGIAPALCWHACDDRGKNPTYCAPSWSWASQLGSIKWDFDLSSYDKQVVYSNILEIRIDTNNGDEFGLILDASITTEAHVLDGNSALGVRVYYTGKAGAQVRSGDHRADVTWDDPNYDRLNLRICLICGKPPVPYCDAMLFSLLLKESDDGSNCFHRIGRMKESFWCAADFYRSFQAFKKVQKQIIIIK